MSSSNPSIGEYINRLRESCNLKRDVKEIKEAWRSLIEQINKRPDMEHAVVSDAISLVTQANAIIDGIEPGFISNEADFLCEQEVFFSYLFDYSSDFSAFISYLEKNNSLYPVFRDILFSNCAIKGHKSFLTSLLIKLGLTDSYDPILAILFSDKQLTALSARALVGERIRKQSRGLFSMGNAAPSTPILRDCYDYSPAGFQRMIPKLHPFFNNLPQWPEILTTRVFENKTALDTLPADVKAFDLQTLIACLIINPTDETRTRILAMLCDQSSTVSEEEVNASLSRLIAECSTNHPLLIVVIFDLMEFAAKQQYLLVALKPASLYSAFKKANLYAAIQALKGAKLKVNDYERAERTILGAVNTGYIYLLLYQINPEAIITRPPVHGCSNLSDTEWLGIFKTFARNPRIKLDRGSDLPEIFFVKLRDLYVSHGSELQRFVTAFPVLILNNLDKILTQQLMDFIEKNPKIFRITKDNQAEYKIIISDTLPHLMLDIAAFSPKGNCELMPGLAALRLKLKNESQARNKGTNVRWSEFSDLLLHCASKDYMHRRQPDSTHPLVFFLQSLTNEEKASLVQRRLNPGKYADASNKQLSLEDLGLFALIYAAYKQSGKQLKAYLHDSELGPNFIRENELASGPYDPILIECLVDALSRLSTMLPAKVLGPLMNCNKVLNYLKTIELARQAELLLFFLKQACYENKVMLLTHFAHDNRGQAILDMAGQGIIGLDCFLDFKLDGTQSGRESVESEFIAELIFTCLVNYDPANASEPNKRQVDNCFVTVVSNNKRALYDYLRSKARSGELSEYQANANLFRLIRTLAVQMERPYALVSFMSRSEDPRLWLADLANQLSRSQATLAID